MDAYDLEPLDERPPPPPPPPSRPESAVAIDSTGHVAEHIACRTCGYDLCGLSERSRCPECGTPVGRSIQGNLLKFSDPDWVDRLRVGTTWLLVSIIGGIAAGMLGGIAGSGSSSDAIGAAIDIVFSAIGLVGYWIVTTPDPGVLDEKPLSARRLVRWCMVLSMAAPLLVFCAEAFADQLSQSGYLGLQGIAIVPGIVGVVGYFALFVYAAGIADRVPDDSLASQTRLVMWGVISCYGGLLVVGGIALLLAQVGIEATAAGILVLFGCAGVAGLLVFGIWSIILVFMYRNAMTRATAEARATWAADMQSSTVAY